MNRKNLLSRLFLFTIAFIVGNANASTCTPTHIQYSKGGTIGVPCVQIGDEVIGASFKLIEVSPQHVWELQQITPANANASGARAVFSEDGRLSIPLTQLSDGSLWQAELQYTGEVAGKHLFNLTNAPKLDPKTDLSKLRINLGTPTAFQTRKTDNGISQAITEAVLKVERVEITGTDSSTMNLDISGNIDLLKVINGEPQLLGEILLPADTHIGQLSLILTDGSYVIADGEQYPLNVPSGEQTGLKIHGDWELNGGKITEVQLDFRIEDIRFNRGTGYRIQPTAKVVSITVTDDPTTHDYPQVA